MNNLYAKSQLDARELLLLESEVKSKGKSTLVAYVLWYFLGYFGGHRFYLGKKGSAVAMLILTITIAGIAVTAVWWIVDAFLTYKMVNEYNEDIESFTLAQILRHKEQGGMMG